jgi:hypothetical protein
VSAFLEYNSLPVSASITKDAYFASDRLGMKTNPKTKKNSITATFGNPVILKPPSHIADFFKYSPINDLAPILNIKHDSKNINSNIR